MIERFRAWSCFVLGFARRGWGRIGDVGSLDLFWAGLGIHFGLKGLTSCVRVRSAYHVQLSRALNHVPDITCMPHVTWN